MSITLRIETEELDLNLKMKTICISCYALQPSSIIRSSAAAVPQSYNCKRLKHVPGLTSGVYNRAGNSPDVSFKNRKGERGFLLARHGLRDEEGRDNLDREEVIKLLIVAVNTLLRPENKQHLIEKLRRKRHHVNQDLPYTSQPSSDMIRSEALPAQSGRFVYHEDVKNSEIQNSIDSVDVRTLSGQPSSRSIFGSTKTLARGSAKLDNIAVDLSQEQSRDIKIESRDVDTRTETSITDIRNLKVLNVHSYVHNALRRSALRTWLQSRSIAD